MFYEAFMKRKITDDLGLRKLALITAIHSNTNYDQKEANKQEILESIESRFDDAIASLYMTEQDQKIIDDELNNNEFLKAGRRGFDKYELLSQSKS